MSNTKKRCILCRETTHFFNNCNDAYIDIFFDEHQHTINKNYLYNIDFYIDNIIHKAIIVFNMLCTQQFCTCIFTKPIINIFTDLLKKENMLNIKILSKKYGLNTSSQKIFQIEAIISVYINKIKSIYQKIIGILISIIEYNNYSIIFEIHNIDYLDFIVSLSIITIVKYYYFDHNAVVNNFYSLYNTHKDDKLLKGIHIAIDKLFDYRYVFTEESEFHVQNWSFNINIIHKEESQSYSELNELCSLECPICMDKINGEFVKTNCNHYYCSSCFNQTIKNLNIYRKPSCSLCRTNITELDIYIKDKDIICITNV